jgi:hypothetical protein
MAHSSIPTASISIIGENYSQKLHPVKNAA